MEQIQIKSDNEKITAICGELQIVHKFGSQEIDVYEKGEMLFPIMVMQKINPLNFIELVMNIVKDIDKLKETIKSMKKTDSKTMKQMQYEKKAMQWN